MSSDTTLIDTLTLLVSHFKSLPLLNTDLNAFTAVLFRFNFCFINSVVFILCVFVILTVRSGSETSLASLGNKIRTVSLTYSMYE